MNILNTCVTRCMDLPSQKRNMIHKPVYCCAAKCKTEFGNWDKACTGIMQGGLAGERKPPFLLLKLLSVTGFDILPYNWLHCKNLGLDFSLTELWAHVSEGNGSVCTLGHTGGEKDVIGEAVSDVLLHWASSHKFTHWALLCFIQLFLTNYIWEPR